MAASYAVKLKKGDTVTSLFGGEVKQNFTQKGNDAKGELSLKVDGSVKIAYEVKGDTATFKVIQAPKLFSDSDQKQALQQIFG
jgi:hypothetical protein